MASEWGVEVLALNLCLCVVRSCPLSTLQRSALLGNRAQTRALSCGKFFIVLDGSEVWLGSFLLDCSQQYTLPVWNCLSALAFSPLVNVWVFMEGQLYRASPW